MANVHSLFPPSATKRLLACPGSYARSLVVGAGVRRASVFSAEGTLAHTIAETILLSKVQPSFFIGRAFDVDGHTFTVDQPFLDAVMIYVNYLDSLVALDFKLTLEKRIDPSPLWFDKPLLPLDLFGTSDCIARHPMWDKLIVVDLKFGKGVPIDPLENPQLLYYAAGAMAVMGLVPRSVTLVVVQPRLPHGDGPVRQWRTTGEHVRDWARDALYPGVVTALADNGVTLNAGEHCQFCPVFTTCEAPRTLTLDLARQRFAAAGLEDVPADPNALDPLAGVGVDLAVTNDRLLEIIEAARVIEPLIEEARKLVKDRIKDGADFPGWQVVNRRGRRTWNIGDGWLLELLKKHGQDPLQAAAMMSPTQLEEQQPFLFGMLRDHVKDGDPISILQPVDRSRKRTRQSALPTSA